MALPAAPAACQAHVGAKVDASANLSGKGPEGTEGTEPPGEISPAPRSAAAQPLAPSDAEGEPALLGARGDVALTGAPVASCRCLAVAVGQPADGAFQWSGQVPRIAPDSQLVIALSSAGLSCPEAGADAPGASYWGYTVTGPDVIVVVENATRGRPIATGAIIPKPPGGGLFVEPKSRHVVYGRPLSGEGDRCELAVPGAPAKGR